MMKVRQKKKKLIWFISASCTPRGIFLTTPLGRSFFEESRYQHHCSCTSNIMTTKDLKIVSGSILPSYVQFVTDEQSFFLAEVASWKSDFGSDINDSGHHRHKVSINSVAESKHGRECPPFTYFRLSSKLFWLKGSRLYSMISVP